MKQIPYGSIAKLLTLITIGFVAVYGLYVTVMPVKPFWLDEWYIIHNIKFRRAEALWGELDFMQQFPRVYLHILQYVAGAGGFSYTALRVTSYAVHVLAAVFCFRISARLYPATSLWRYLWVAMYLSAPTALEYFVQVKQYTMDMLIGLLGIWQMLMLEKAAKGESNKGGYLLLCASFIAAPFFSYGYPIVAVPLFVAAPLLWLRKSKDGAKLLPILLPLALCAAAITAFYAIDVRYVLQDKGMQDYWTEYMMKGDARIGRLFGNIYKMFLNMASGDLFGNITAVAGLGGLVYFTVQAVRNRLRNIMLYAVLVIWVAIILFAMGKLPMGTHRLNAFAVPAIALIITELFYILSEVKHKAAIASTIITCLLFLAFTSNVYIALLNDISGDEHKHKLAVYDHTAKAIQAAEQQHLPLLVSPDLAYPLNGQINADWVLRTHPAYRDTTVKVLHLPFDANADSLMASLHMNAALKVTERELTPVGK